MYSRALGFSRICGLTRLSSVSWPRVAPALCRHQHRTFDSESTQVKVLYDGLCPICVAEIRFLQLVQRNIKPGRVNFVDISLAGYDGAKHGNVSYEMAMEVMHVIDEKEQVHRGVPAFAVMYNAVGLGWLGRLMMSAPVRPLMDQAYAVFARNRLKWTGRGEECSKGRCEKRTR
ncbi:uncharacterized protein At5g50100, chloroplastic-like [Takifugu rubripes]|uniref:uncharacterized protein At5g50100, chloroplastic-like n=1 Tax=Takifugu rubripes TaxID=31033 RepID=UPI0011456C1E|nr:uncharacterized protein At5g50100, chloroplastic-like [Takifugu rubripes]XP_011600975.2 uncharacterized protein At5g50100, chloroplastic-like [Takifugu rubripes]XP_011600976.2 uncharacterized protein At5g50100, chloroplastic-like [Takifugu rubripes]XP_011600977.2 uncharacterized protein At5g50100, chloroplastic-like [Takifugu rubripes]